MIYDYNTQRVRMSLPEYGRNVQMMVNHAKTIKDRELRNVAARTIINVMGNLNPHLRDQGDFKHKLWDHLALIANFELDIDSPYPKPSPSQFTEKPDSIPYLQGFLKYPHYGRIIQSMIREMIQMPDGNDRKYLTILVLNQMKRSYVTWNKSSVTDEVIINDFREICHGLIEVPEGVKLVEVKETSSGQQQQQQQGNKKKPQKSFGGQSQGGGNRSQQQQQYKKKQGGYKPHHNKNRPPQGKKY